MTLGYDPEVGERDGVVENMTADDSLSISSAVERLKIKIERTSGVYGYETGRCGISW
jgi:hypothetical protein